jgi:FkbM family methyltransferase
MIPESLKRPLRAAVWRRLALKWQLPSGVVIEVRSHGDWYIYNEIFVGGEYDLPLRRCIESAARPGAPRATILDLGANVGFFYLRWLDLWRQAGMPGAAPRFVLVEGVPRTCDELRARLAAQTGPGAEVTVLNNLIGPRNGFGTITDSHVHFGNRLTTGKGRTVPFLDIIAMFGGKPIDLLKCDIEGGEQLFLESQPELLLSTRTAAVELHHAACDTGKCAALLEAAGFSSRRTLRDGGDFSVSYWTRCSTLD